RTFHLEPRSVSLQPGGGSGVGWNPDSANVYAFDLPLLCPVRVNQYFAGLARLQAFHTFREVLHCDSIGYHGMQFELACLEQRSHLIPGLIHAAPIDALNRDSLKNDVFGKIERNWLRGDTEERNTTATPHDVKRCSNGIGMAGHLEHDIRTLSTCAF